MKKLKYIVTVLLYGLMSACNTLDVPPINVVQDDVAFTDTGMQAYMAGLYSRLPIEDFKYTSAAGSSNNNGFFSWDQIATPSINTGENANRNNGGAVNPAQGYWGGGYLVIRNANYLIDQLPSYVEKLTQPKIDRWIAEARMVRAYTYFALAKRYGGIPIVTEVQGLDDGDALLVPRSSEQASYDFILGDIDLAIAGLPTTSEQSGRFNKNIAYAFKSRVALFAGSRARYGLQKVADDGVMINGFPADKNPNDYFTLSWQAAKAIEGVYSLYNKTAGSTDKVAVADNYANLFLDAGSNETIFAKGYSYGQSVHSFDCVYGPPHMVTTYGDRFNPTLDYVELFDGLPLNAKGQLNTLNPDGSYHVYNSAEELFVNCEPRLRGTVLLPGHAIKPAQHGKGLARVDLRRATIVYTVDPATFSIKKGDATSGFPAEGSTVAYGGGSTWYQTNVVGSTFWNQQTKVPTDAAANNPYLLNASGLDGPTNTAAHATVTGFHGRKWMVPTLPVAETRLHASTQPWIDIRYAEVLLNRAEAALELVQHGVASVDGVDLLTDAYMRINNIRSRAGATLLTSPADLSTGAPIGVEQGQGGYVLAPTRGLQILRIERRKELAFEQKLWWDMLRWRTAHLEVNNRAWRKLNPFLFAKGTTVDRTIDDDHPVGKYIFDCRLDERNSRFTVPVERYYEPIPSAEINANPLLKQN